MNFKLKHSIIAFFSLTLLLGTLFIDMPANSVEQVKDVRFGYPLQFVSQDFDQCKVDYLIPWHFKFNLLNGCHIKNFYFFKFLASYIIIFIAFELLIHLLETLDFWIRQ